MAKVHRIVLVYVALMLVGAVFLAPQLMAATLNITYNVKSSGWIKSSGGAWALIGSQQGLPEFRNIVWFFGNQNIPYFLISPSQAKDYASLQDYVGIVIWTNLNITYNSTAFRIFSENKPVIAHISDFCNYMYPSLKNSVQKISAASITYKMDWGDFRMGDTPTTDDGTGHLTTVSASSLSSFANVTQIAEAQTGRIALLHMKGKDADAGFYVMDLFATRPNSYEAGNWHFFPAIEKATAISLGRYTRWMTYYHSLDWIYNWMTELTAANRDIVKMRSIGSSVQGRPINAFFIGNGTRYFIADAAIHGGETSGPPAILRFAELLTEWGHSLPEWQSKLKQYTVILIPVLNPDGFVARTRTNANGIDLNRQFPPAASTTEPEAWALRRLMGNYTPTQYVTLHSGGEHDPLTLYYAGSGIYRTYTALSVNEANLLYQDLRHYGTVFDTIWIGKYYRTVNQVSSMGMSAQYAYYIHNATSTIVEHWGANMANLQSTEYYVTVMLGFMGHHDRTNGFIIHSSCLITQSTYASGTGLKVDLDPKYITSNRTSETKIYSLNNMGKPSIVYIDGSRKLEGDGWSWDSTARIITVKEAGDSILLKWS